MKREDNYIKPRQGGPGIAEIYNQAQLNTTARDHGHPISLAELLGEMAFYRNTKTGAISLVHRSGSYVCWEVDGRLTTHAAASLVQSAEKYIYTGRGPAPDDSTQDAENLARVAVGDPIAIQELIIQKRVPHLYEAAVKTASEHGHLD